MGKYIKVRALGRRLADFHPAFEDWLDARGRLKVAQTFGEVFLGDFAEFGELGAAETASAGRVWLRAREFFGNAFWLGFYGVAIQVEKKPNGFAGVFGPSCLCGLGNGRRNRARDAKAEENGLGVGFWGGFAGECFEGIAR